MYWEKYGPYAIGEFSNIQFTNSVTYKFQILKKNYNIRPLFNPGGPPSYTDPIISCLCGSDPIVIRTLTDDVFGVKGSEAELNLINLDGQLPLSAFYAEEDDTFKIVITATYLDSGSVSQTKTIFSGFLVQEDCTEELIDIGHNIKLSFTDNLGTLKNLSFGDAVKISATSAANLRFNVANVSVLPESTTNNGYIQLNTFITVGTPAVGDYVVLNNSPVGDCVYTIIKIEDVGATKRLYVREKVLTFSNVQVDIAYITGNNPLKRLSLHEIIRICLHGTNLLLDFKFGNQAYAQTETQSIPYPLDLQIDGRTFLSGEDNWVSCYDVLEQICMSFSASLFQSDNIWYMVRWNELRYQNNQIVFTNYNNYISNQFTTVQYAPNTLPGFETGLEETILRPYNYYTNQFNFQNPSTLLYNSNLQILGPKVSEQTINYQVGTNFVSAQRKEYTAEGWTINPAFLGDYTATIVVITSNVNQEELDRFLKIKAVGSQSKRVNILLSQPFEVDEKDELLITFSYKVSENNTNPLGLNNEFEISSQINAVYNDHQSLTANKVTVQENIWYKWEDNPIGGGTLLVNDFVDTVSGDTQTEFRNVTFKSRPTRKSTIQIIIGHYDRNNVANSETIYKNFRVEVKNQSSNYSFYKGQQHKSYINKIVKNNQIQNIFIDSSPSNTILGTLLSSQKTNTVQNKVYTFRDGVSLFEGRLGELMTRQMMDWRYIQRIKLEGKILGIYKSSFQWLTLHQALIFSLKSGKYFIFGKAVYNLREDFIEATLYEMWKVGEECTTRGVATNENLDYDFKFLY